MSFQLWTRFCSRCLRPWVDSDAERSACPFCGSCKTTVRRMATR